MGILDEAIREHLDLKRRQGADDDELKRLEDEAFGPPTRPGEPDFPGQPGESTGADGPQAGESAAADVAVAEPSPEPEDEASALEPSATPDALDEPTPESEDASASELTSPGEPELPVLPEAPAADAVPETEERPEEGGFFDQAGSEGIELGEIDLDLDEGLEEVRELDEPSAPEPPPPTLDEPPAPTEPPTLDEPPASPPSEPPIESLDTVEHPVPDALDEPPAPQPPAREPGGEGSQGDDDMLEETPEFLRDAPEDDELWFEQGEPKDFDFDDD